MRRAPCLVGQPKRAESSGLSPLVSFGFMCGRILGRDRCWAALSATFHFRAGPTVELLSVSPKLILTISSLERGSYRGALQYVSGNVYITRNVKMAMLPLDQPLDRGLYANVERNLG